MTHGQIQLTVFSALVALVSVASIAYIAVAQPDSLRKTRAGVPYFTPPVEHPETGEPLLLDDLVEHYKGE